MKNTYLLSEDAKNYLCCYYQTLDGMIQSLTTANLTQSISRNFTAQMVPHCRAAIQMSNNVLRYTENSTVRRVAQRLIDEQTQSISQMEAAQTACGQITNPKLDLRLYQRRMDLICREMYTQMGAAPEGNRLDAIFLRQLLPHCQGAVHMAENALKYDISTDLVPLLRDIAVRQRQRINQFQSLLRRMGCQRG